MASSDSNEPKLNVKDVCKKFLMKSDELLAKKLQTEEYFDHTKKNRFLKQINRENIRKSIPLVESIQTDQQKHIKNLELENDRLKKLAEDDKNLANELQEKYMREIELEQLRRDEELAKTLQQEEILTESASPKKTQVNQNIYEESYYHDPDDDYSLAVYLQQQEQRQHSRETIDDEELARRLQYSENSRLDGNLYSQNQKVRKL